MDRGGSQRVGRSLSRHAHYWERTPAISLIRERWGGKKEERNMMEPTCRSWTSLIDLKSLHPGARMLTGWKEVWGVPS